ncbi:MAG: cell wall-binding repeat-containing protein [Desulfitobacteriaceae bacterium]
MTTTKKYFFLSFFFFGILMLAYTPKVDASTVIDRLAGDDRYQTAIDVSQSGWPDGADSAILVYGENFPDALSAGSLAHKYTAPILLTGSKDLNSDTAVELKRLKVKKVYIVGGYAVVSGDVEKQLSLMDIVSVRLAGQDRYETALIVAQEVGVSQGVFVTTGLDFPDALSVAPIAAAKGMPIILVPQNDLTPIQKSFLSTNKIPNGFIVKGNAEISDNVVSQFPGYEVISGADPYERNINLIRRFADSLDLDTVYIATGENFPDALTASALAQKGQNVIILLQGNTIPSQVSFFIKSKVISKINILGGYGVINASTEAALVALSAQIVSVVNLKDSIEEQQKYELPKTATVIKTDGLEVEVPVTWSLTSVNSLQAGTYKYEGKIKGYNNSVYLTLTVNPIVTKVNNITAEIIQGGSYHFPDTVAVTMSDCSVKRFPVTWSSNIVTLNKTGTYPFQGNVEGLTQKVTLTLKVSEDTKINFTDQNLKSVVGDLVGKDIDETIYKSDVLNIDSIKASSSSITDLTGLEYFSNLKTLYLANNSLTKVTSLMKLTNLEVLKLNNTELKDLSALKGLTSLTYLNISNNNIKDFSQLRDFTRLTTLYLENNLPLIDTPNYTPDYSPVRLYYHNLSSKDFSL